MRVLIVSTGYMPNIDTHLAAAAAAKWERELTIVRANDDSLAANGLEAATAGVEPRLAALPPRGNTVAAAYVVAREGKGALPRRNGRHVLVEFAR